MPAIGKSTSRSKATRSDPGNARSAASDAPPSVTSDCGLNEGCTVNSVHPSPHERGVDADVPRVVAGIGFVTGHLQCAIDRPREIGVDLDEAVQPALIAAEGAPRLVADVFDRHAFARRQHLVRERARATAVDGLRHHLGQASGRDQEAPLEGVVTVGERAGAWKETVDLRAHVGQARLVGRRRHDAEERRGFLRRTTIARRSGAPRAARWREAVGRGSGGVRRWRRRRRARDASRSTSAAASASMAPTVGVAARTPATRSAGPA